MKTAARLAFSAALALTSTLWLRPANAQTTTLDPFVTSGLSSPVDLAMPNDGSGRMFVAEQNGTIKVVDMNATTPSVVATYLAVDVRFAGEQGLLSLVFDPNFGINPGQPGYGAFYVAFTAPSSAPQLGDEPDQVLRRYTVSNPASNDASGASGIDVMRIPDIYTNHNGAKLNFGPDGYLYYSMGDGGSGGDPEELAQDTGRETVNGNEYYLLGKMMRIDVHNPAASVSGNMCGASFRTGQAEYSIPSGNPFAGSGSECGEIWLYGLRNPFRFSFDRDTGDLWIGDVGQGSWEEVDRIPAGSIANRNLGWDRCEGNHYQEASGSGMDCPATTGTVAPTLEYSSGPSTSNCTVIGGYRYRGPISDLNGKYVYADYCSGLIWVASQSGNNWTSVLFPQTIGGIVAFGEDPAGNLYAIDQGSSRILKFNGDTDVIFADGFEG